MAGKVPKSVKEAKGSTWKKAMWWCLGILGVIGTITLVICLIRRKGPLTTTTDIMKGVKHKVNKIDIEAKAETAKAQKVEQKVIDKINAAAEIKDERERLQALAAALAEDY
jgi:hypothetical protein